MKKILIAITTLVVITGSLAWAENANIKILSVFASSEYSVKVVYEVDKPAFVECFGKDKDGNIIAHGNDIAVTVHRDKFVQPFFLKKNERSKAISAIFSTWLRYSLTANVP